MNEPSLMIFAAGFGTRMGELTRNMPKPMLEVGGKPMIDYAIECGREVHASALVANTHYQADKIEPYLRERGVIVSSEKPSILDTGGGIKAAAKLLSSPTYTLNPDTLWMGPNPLDILRDHRHRVREGAVVLLVPLSRTHHRVGGGDFAVSEGRVSRSGDMVYSGAQLIHTRVLDEISEPVFSLNVVWDMLIERRQLIGVEYPGEWMDIGTPEGLVAANQRLRA